MNTEEGQAFGLSELERRRLIRLDSAKVNVAPPMAEAKWFKLVGVNIGNATEAYPNGDEVQAIEAWTPPDTFAGLSNSLINEILTKIDAGLPDGTLYSDAPNAKASAAWRVIANGCPGGKSEPACRQIIRLWVKSGLLVQESYHHKVARKTAIGLRVDHQKRPT
jgi:hypothetical protein